MEFALTAMLFGGRFHLSKMSHEDFLGFFVLFVFSGSRPVSSTLVSQFTGGDVLGREEPAWTEDGDGREKWEWNLPKQTLGLIKTSVGRQSGVRIPHRHPEENVFPRTRETWSLLCRRNWSVFLFLFLFFTPLPFLFAVTWGDFPSAVNSLNFKSECKWRRRKVGGFEAAADLNRPVVFLDSFPLQRRLNAHREF